MKRLRKLSLILLCIVLVGAVVWRVSRHFVPQGAEIMPFLFASTSKETVTSPSGQKLSYKFNDGGAAHSGLHYTWCYVDHWLTGKKVIASGYSLPDVRSGKEEFPLIWHEGGRNFSVRFAAGRHDETILWFSATLP